MKSAIKGFLAALLGAVLSVVGFSALDSWQFWVIIGIYAVGVNL